jgi:hypothetical protein
MEFVIGSTLIFFILSCIVGLKKGGEGKVLLIFIILEIICLFKYGFTMSFLFSLVWNFIVLIGIINGIVKGKGNLYLSEKYDENHKND